MLKKLSLFVVVCILMAFTIGCSFAAVERMQNPASVQALGKQKIAPLNKLPNDLIQKANSPMSRSAMFNTLMQNPITKENIVKFAKANGIAESQISLIGSKTIRELSNKTPESAQPLSDADLDYQKIKWEDGITFRHNAVPTYNNGKYHLGDYYIEGCVIETSKPDINLIDIASKYSFYFISLELELPQGIGTYMIGLKMWNSRGECPPSMIEPLSQNATAPIMVNLNYYSSNKESLFLGVPFVPMADGTGYVGIVNINSGMLPYPHTHSTMRRCNAKLDFYCNKNCSPSKKISQVLFGGITITKL